MSNWAEVISGTAFRIIISNTDPTSLIPTTGEWIDVTGTTVAVGWTYSGGVWTGPEGQAPSSPPAPQIYRKLLKAAEWVYLWSDSEYAGMKSFRNNGTANGDRLDKLIDAIMVTESVNLEAQEMQDFYAFIVAQGFITQARSDELQMGLLD